MPTIRILLRGATGPDKYEVVSYLDHPHGASVYVLNLPGGGQKIINADEVVEFERLAKST